jgi:RNA-binding protein
MTLTSQQKQELKKQAHHLKPMIQIGKNGVNPQQIEQIKIALQNHQLIKIKFNNKKTQKEQLTQKITSQIESELINLIGNTIIIYKEKSEK